MLLGNRVGPPLRQSLGTPRSGARCLSLKNHAFTSNFTYLGVNQLRRKYRIISACYRHCLQTKSNRSRVIPSQRIRKRSYGRQRQNHGTPDNVRPSTAHSVLTFESLLTFKGLSLCLRHWLAHMIFQYPLHIPWTTCPQFIGPCGIIQNSRPTRHYVYSSFLRMRKSL
jgi:hypothetical protein